MSNPTSINEPAAGLEIRVGAVAMIDALGFRGIWQRHSESEVVAKLQWLAEITVSEANDLQSAARQRGGNVIEFVRPSFLSDTVIFTVATKPLHAVTDGLNAEGWGRIIKFDDDLLAGEAVRIAAKLLGVLLRRALEGPVPLAYRGAIAFGRFGMTDRFLIGPAIDEAASFMNRAQGAFVILAPSAAQYSQAAAPSSLSNLLPYSVPVKPTGEPSTLDTLVVSPFAGIDDSKRKEMRDRLIGSFGTAPNGDVAEKLTNTRKFLEAADEAEKAPLAELLKNAMRP
jgi:hypothetical protein